MDTQSESGHQHAELEYDLRYVESVVAAIYQEYVIKNIQSSRSSDDFLAPYVFFDGIDMLAFESLMQFCKIILHNTNKRYFPIIIKPGVGNAHYVAAMLHKEIRGSLHRYNLFLFDPVGHPDAQSRERLRKRLSLKHLEKLFDINVFVSPHVIQTTEKDGGNGLTSCGPLAIEFIRAMLNNPRLIEQLAPICSWKYGFDDLGLSLNRLMEDGSVEFYRSTLAEIRAQHTELSNQITDSNQIENLYAPLTHMLLNLVDNDDCLSKRYLENLHSPDDTRRFMRILEEKVLKTIGLDPGIQFAQAVRASMSITPQRQSHDPKLFGNAIEKFTTASETIFEGNRTYP